MDNHRSFDFRTHYLKEQFCRRNEKIEPVNGKCLSLISIIFKIQVRESTNCICISDILQHKNKCGLVVYAIHFSSGSSWNMTTIKLRFQNSNTNRTEVPLGPANRGANAGRLGEEAVVLLYPLSGQSLQRTAVRGLPVRQRGMFSPDKWTSHPQIAYSHWIYIAQN